MLCTHGFNVPVQHVLCSMYSILIIVLATCKWLLALCCLINLIWFDLNNRTVSFKSQSSRCHNITQFCFRCSCSRFVRLYPVFSHPSHLRLAACCWSRRDKRRQLIVRHITHRVRRIWHATIYYSETTIPISCLYFRQRLWRSRLLDAYWHCAQLHEIYCEFSCIVAFACQCFVLKVGHSINGRPVANGSKGFSGFWRPQFQRSTNETYYSRYGFFMMLGFVILYASSCLYRRFSVEKFP